MKGKGIVISVLAGAAVVVGTAYGIGTGMKKKAQPVEVVPVPSVNEASYGGMMDSDTLYGTIVSKDTQTVELDTSHTIRKVYVKPGDRVKKGDRLMTYDMELDKLKREAQDLTKQGLALSLESMKRDLATMESGRLPANYGNGDGYDFFNSGTSSDDSSDEDSADAEDEDSDLTGSAQDAAAGIRTERMEKTGSDEAAALPENGGDQEIVDDGSADASEEDAGAQVIIDENGEDGADLSQDDQTVDSSGGDAVQPDEATLSSVNAFLTDVNSLTSIANESFDSLSSDEARNLFTEALDLFRGELADSGETEVTDFFGSTRTVTVYAVKADVSAMVGDATAAVLGQAYDRLCVYQFISAVRQIFPGAASASSSYDYAAVSGVSDRVYAAADAYYQLQNTVCSMDDRGRIVFSSAFSALNDPSFGGESYGDYLTGLIQILNSTAAVIFPETPTSETEPLTEPPVPDEPGGDEGDGTTAEELKNAIEQQKKDIVECQLQIREADLAIREYDRSLAGETVTASMDGIVKQAGTTTEQPSSGGFIVITGKAGMYVQGTVSERSLDSLKVGDLITGTSWDTGDTFTAKVTEISRYPAESGTDSFYYYDSSNDQNSSMYPFLAYIDDAEGLSTDSGVELSIDSSTASAGLMIEPYLVRNDSSGKSFCYVRGDDGKLEKRYVKAKDTGYGTLIITAGLRSEDYIAVAFGDDVQDGAPTKDGEPLSARRGDAYGYGVG